MAQLHLFPTPTVLAVQAGIFLGAIAVIKKLMLDPYLSVRKRRDQLTTGSQEDAKRALAAAVNVSEKITQKIDQAAADARLEKETIHSKAITEKNEIVAAADADAKSVVARVTERIQAEIAEEKSKIPTTVASLSDEVYGLVVQ